MTFLSFIFGKIGDDARWGRAILSALIVGLTMVSFLGYFGGGGRFGVLVAFFIGAAAVSVGGMLGFLFGIPRAIQHPQATDGSLSANGISYAVNTNLEDISKWLTGTIVGLTLIQARPLINKFDILCAALEQAFPPGSTVKAPLIGSILIYFSSTGAVGSYLWTRLMLTNELRRVELRARQSSEYYEGLVHALLYQPPPRGFRSAIAQAREYEKEFGEDNWRIHQALACAHGQEYGYLKEHNGSAEDLQAARQKALAAAKRVIELYPSERESLRHLWDKDKATGQENDLVVFFDDPDFRKLFSTADEKTH